MCSGGGCVRIGKRRRGNENVVESEQEKGIVNKE